ncbi:glycoside hydrolase family 2 TIM barrel-domain containing protein [Halosolutus gelatinilyticus]|uniref:glycoside hydrolase family 2 TIM barrel-domain containing protein n=1 Tax=Halosolutus gelatinilyticus TaxID=2931975 RepID=UPI001FF65C25|nr:glycoside hydrolase family 2 TIM barrel-domain containing protein [Halosolutus gelatinilyticus]
MSRDNSNRGIGEPSLHRRTVLSAVSGAALGATLPIGGASVAPVNEYDDVLSSIQLTPRPATTDAGGTRSLNGTWEFALSPGERPPSSSSRRVTPDLSGAGNDGTLRNEPPIVTDPTERAVDLADESYVAVGDADGVDFTEPGFSIQLTFKYAGDGPLYAKGDQYALGVWGGQLSFWTEGGGNWPGIDAGDLSRGHWYTTTLVVDDSEIRLYLGTTEIGATSHDFSSLPSADSPLHLGYDSGNDDHGSPVVDSFRAFDTVLSTDRIDRGFDRVPDSAVAWLPLNEVESGVTPDESGAGNDGVLYGDPAIVPGRDGRGVDVSGDGYVSVAADETLDFSSPGFTLRTTVKYDGGDGPVLDRGHSAVADGAEQFGLGIYDGTVSFWLQTDAGDWPSVSGGDLSTGEWHTVTVVVARDELRLYVDGARVGSSTHDATDLASSDARFVVGGSDLDVAVASTRAFDTALSDDRIERGFQAVPDGAVLWLDYDTIEDLGVEWHDEDVPGQWAYDGYAVPSGSEEWYPPDGTLGWYRREFEVPDGWADGRLLLRFDAVYSEARVFVNDSEVGHHVGGYTPFEVDATDAVTADGANALAVAVAQQSPADDMGWQNVTGGITRDVTLLSVPDVHVAACDVTTGLRGSSAAVTVETAIRNAGARGVESATVTVTLTDPEGATVATAERPVSALDAGSSGECSFELEASDPQPWNPEQPRLYTVDVTIEADGTTETISERIGIRDVSVVGNELRLNGEAVTLRGVNWEEIHLAEHGHAVPAEITREDARRLKEANVNYVRTAHHPTSEAFLDACDELGIVVEMEAPHMFVGRGRGDPDPDVVLRQTLEMVERDKNRASVCLWSIANESEWYDAFDAAGRLVAELDPTRPTIFNHDAYDPDDPWHDVYDVRAHHYPAFRTGSTVEEHADLDEPILFDEAAHTYCYNDRELVTDPGLRDEWGLPFELIWEQCRAADSVAGAAIWAGGDHLEQWGEYRWGLLDRNRRSRPEYWHVKKVYSPVRVADAEWRGNGNAVTLTIENRHEFVDLADRSIRFEGTPGSGRRPIHVPPGERTTVTLPVEDDRLEMTVTHPEGHAIERIVVTPESPRVEIPSEPATEPFADDDGTLSVATDVYSLDIDRESGAVEVRTPDGAPLIVDAPELALTPTQQSTGRDYASAIDHRLSDRTVADVTVAEDGAAVSIAVEYDDAAGTVLLRPLADGLEVEYEFALHDSVDAREVGLAVPTATDLMTLSWLRDAQWSVYPDTHIGRPGGTACAFPDGSRPNHEEIRIRSGQPWKNDATKHGSNDFRGTKRNVYAADLTAAGGHGLGVRSDGDQHVRSQVRSESIEFLILDRSLSGTNADGWLSRHPVVDQDPTLASGETLRGSVTLQVIDGDANAPNGESEHASADPDGAGRTR